MLALGKDRILLIRRTGILQLVKRDDGSLLNAVKLEDVEEVMDAWSLGDLSFILLPNGKILQIDQDLTMKQFASLERSVGASSTMKLDNDKVLLAVAGKDLLPSVYSLKVGEGLGLIWSAKQPKPDKLGMHIKVDLRSVTFLDAQRLAVGTAKGEVWLYDTCTGQALAVGAKKIFEGRPVAQLSRLDDWSFLASDNRGTFESFTADPISRLGGFKGHTGAVTSTLTSASLIVSTGADRFVLGFNPSDRTLLHKVFLGHQPTSCLLLKVSAQPTKGTAEDDALWTQLTRVKE